MKNLMVLTLLIAFILMPQAIALAKDPLPHPASIGKASCSIKLTAAQMQGLQSGNAGTPVDTVLTEKQLKKVKKSWPDFNGNLAKINKDHVYGKKKVNLILDGANLVSTPAPK